MASEAGGVVESADGGFGSLFEGMVLFTPFDHAPPPPTPSPPPPPPPPAAEAAASVDAASPAPVVSRPLPLDEDLFSDLTLQVSASASPPPSLSPSPVAPQPPARHTSRKKKRAVRIGYARDDAAPLEESHPLPSPLSPANGPPPLPHSQQEPEVVLPPAALPCPEFRASPFGTDSDRSGREEEVEVATEECGSSAALQQDAHSPCTKEDEEGEGEEGKAPLAEAPSDEPDSSGSMEDQLALIRSQISQKLNFIRQRASSVTAKRKELGAKRRAVAEDVSSASTRYKDLERELEEACEAEDFERAERISESIAAAENEKDRLLMALKDAELDYDSVDTEMQELLGLQIEAEEEGTALLEQFAKEAANNAELVCKNAEDISSKEIESWQQSMELVEIKKLEMEVELLLISGACSGLDGAVEHLVEDDQREKHILMKKGDVLAKELTDLLELVRLKEAEIAENNNQIKEVERRISNAVSEFHGTRSSVDTKLENLEAARFRVDSEIEVVFSKKKEIDEFISSVEHKSSKLMELSRDSSDEAKCCRDLVRLRRNLASSISKSRQDRVELAKTEEKILQHIQVLRQQIADARTSLQELSSARACTQEEITLSKQRINFIDKRGPTLEAEKKVAASARNFKEAGRIAAEAKQLNNEKEEVQLKWERAAVELENLEERIRWTADKIQEDEGLVLLEEKEAAMAGYKRLRLVAAAARAERAAALETGDLEEGGLLLKEAEVAESKVRELQLSYDLQPVEDGGTLQNVVVPLAVVTNLFGADSSIP